MDELRSDALKLALRLRKGGGHHVGLLPAQAGIDLWKSGVALAEALAEVGGVPACFVDFTGRYAGTSRTIEKRAHCEIIGGAGGVVTLRTEMALLKLAYAHIVVDLSGFKARGEHLEAVALLDGVLQFVQLGATNEAAVLRHQLEFPSSVNLGIVTVTC